MKSKILIGLLIIVAFLALGADFLVNSGYQVVSGTVRTDFIKSAERGLQILETESQQDRPVCIMVNANTGEAWIYVHEVKVHTNPSGITRETVFQGFKKLDKR